MFFQYLLLYPEEYQRIQTIARISEVTDHVLRKQVLQWWSMRNIFGSINKSGADPGFCQSFGDRKLLT